MVLHTGWSRFSWASFAGQWSDVSFYSTQQCLCYDSFKAELQCSQSTSFLASTCWCEFSLCIWLMCWFYIIIDKFTEEALNWAYNKLMTPCAGLQALLWGVRRGVFTWQLCCCCKCSTYPDILCDEVYTKVEIYMQNLSNANNLDRFKYCNYILWWIALGVCFHGDLLCLAVWASWWDDGFWVPPIYRS